MSIPRKRSFALIALAMAASLIAACSGGGSGEPDQRTVNGHTLDLSPDQAGRVRVAKVDAIAAGLPQTVRERGTLVVTGLTGAAPPLRMYATDDRTVIGSEVDIAYLIADILGLQVELRTADWAQNFIAIDSGAADAFISNVTVTEGRKEKYDFATYRFDQLALEVPNSADWIYTDRKSLAGKKIGVANGTNQAQVLLDWDTRNRAEGLAPIEVLNFPQVTDYYLALSSGRIDGFLGAGPDAQYHVAVTGQTKIAATFSGAGDVLQAEVGALTKKDSGLVGPVRDALQYAIDHGSYQQVLRNWALESEAITQSRINPPGLPKK